MNTQTAPAKRVGDITLRGVTIAFPVVFKPKKFGNGTGPDEPKYSCTVVLDKKKDAGQIKALKALIEEARQGDKVKGAKVLYDNQPLKEGSDRKKEDGTYPDGFNEDTLHIGAKSGKKPHVLDRDKTPIGEDADKIHGGAVCDVAINIWGQVYNGVKRINCGLNGVRWLEEGKRYEGGKRDPDEMFDDMPDDAPDPRD